MFNFLRGGSKPAPKNESQRERFKRLVRELNEMIDTMPTKPRVMIDLETGQIVPEVPSQFQDEALALPKPADAPAPPATPETPKSNAAAGLKPNVPTPRVPEARVQQPRVGAPRVGAASTKNEKA
jgi:hypothetical protein